MVVMVLAITGILIIGGNKRWFTLSRDNPPRHATINNILLRIDTNVFRLQVTMENLVFSAYPAELKEFVDKINSLEASIHKDFKELEAHVGSGNAQYKMAFAEFLHWRSTRDEIISLTTAGPSFLAKKLVRSKCAIQALNIRSNLMELGRNDQ